MKEGLLGGTLGVSSRSESKEARLHVARWSSSVVSIGQAGREPIDVRARVPERFTPPRAVEPPPADVRVTKTADRTVVNVGDEFTYRVTALNRGPGVAGSVVLTDTPDPNVALISATPSQGTCSPALPASCQVGPLSAGQSATVLVRVRATAAGSLRNAVTAITPTTVPPTTGAPGSPGAPADRVAVRGVIVRSATRVGLRKRADRRTVRSGQRVTFTLTATARGRGVARDISVCDRVPSGLTVVDPGAARLTDGRWCWNIATLAAGRSRALQIVMRANAVNTPTRRTNVATLAVGDQAPRIARARILVVPPNARLTG
jgi:uncharacterized repeat protein (TIGR01451 family)